MLDNERAELWIEDGENTVDEAGGFSTVTARLVIISDGTGPEGSDVTITASLPGNSDYEASPAVFGPGEGMLFTSDVVLTAINDQRLEEAVETFSDQALQIVSDGGANASISDTSGTRTVHVLDNERAEVSIADGTNTVTEDGDTSTVTATLTLITDGTGPAGSDVTIDVTLPGNADYTASTASFEPGDGTTFTSDITLEAINDGRLEAPIESFPMQGVQVIDNNGANVAVAWDSGNRTVHVVDSESTNAGFGRFGPSDGVTSAGSSAVESPTSPSPGPDADPYDNATPAPTSGDEANVFTSVLEAAALLDASFESASESDAIRTVQGSTATNTAAQDQSQLRDSELLSFRTVQPNGESGVRRNLPLELLNDPRFLDKISRLPDGVYVVIYKEAGSTIGQQLFELNVEDHRFVAPRSLAGSEPAAEVDPENDPQARPIFVDGSENAGDALTGDEQPNDAAEAPTATEAETDEHVSSLEPSVNILSTQAAAAVAAAMLIATPRSASWRQSVDSAMEAGVPSFSRSARMLRRVFN